MDGTTIWTLAVVLLVVLVVAVVLFYRKNPRKKAQQGRAYKKDRVVGAVQSFARQNQFRYIAPAAVRSGDDAAMLDAVVVGYFGVLGVISLGYNGEVYGAADDDTWTHVAPGGQREKFASPIKESAAAVRVLRNVLLAGKQKRIPVEVIYVFSDDKAQLAIPRSVGVMRVKDLKNLLRKDRFLDDCGLEMEAVEAVIKAAVQPQ